MYIREVPQRLADGRTVVHLQLVESYRDERGSPRTRILASLGRATGDGLRRVQNLLRASHETLTRHASSPPPAPTSSFALAELECIAEAALARHVVRGTWEALGLADLIAELVLERQGHPDLPRDTLGRLLRSLLPSVDHAPCPVGEPRPTTDEELTELVAGGLSRVLRALLLRVGSFVGGEDGPVVVKFDRRLRRVAVVGPGTIPLLVVPVAPGAVAAGALVDEVRAAHPGQVIVAGAEPPEARCADCAARTSRLQVLSPEEVPPGVSPEVLAATGRYADLGDGLGAKELRSSRTHAHRLVLLRQDDARRVLLTDDRDTPAARLAGAWWAARRALDTSASTPEREVTAHGLALLVRTVAERRSGLAWARLEAALAGHRAVVVRHAQGRSVIHAPLSDDVVALLTKLGLPPPMSGPLT